MERSWEDIIDRAEPLAYKEASADKLYYKQYHTLRSYAESIKSFDKHSLQMLAMAVYSWMPTILDSSSGEEEAIEAINRHKKECISRASSDIEIIKKYMNSSYVGASKLLHFIQPESFPIWDSHAARAVLERENCAGKWKEFKKYIELMRQPNVPGPDLERAKEISKILHKEQPVSDLRSLELCLYLVGKSEQPPKKKKTA